LSLIGIDARRAITTATTATTASGTSTAGTSATGALSGQHDAIASTEAGRTC
jgi:hypothetical protein